MRIKLKPNQTACSARIFLNIFGFTIENKSDLNEKGKLKIFDKDNNEVGEFHLDENTAYIDLNYNGNILSAKYNIPKIACSIDADDNILDKYVDWNSLIRFHYYLNDGAKLEGTLNLQSFIDNMYGNRCTLHTDMNFQTLDNKRLRFVIFHNGTLFYVGASDNNISEDIDILVDYNEFLGYAMFHQKTEKLDGDRKNKFFSKIGEYATEPGYKRLITREYDSDKEIRFYNNKYVKNKDIVVELMDNIKLIKSVDPLMFEKIQKLCEVFKIGDTLILKNIVSASFDSYTDIEFENIFGFTKDKSFYQDGANSLTNSYFATSVYKVNEPINSLIK